MVSTKSPDIERLNELRGRRDNGEELPAAPGPLNLDGKRLQRADLAHLDLSGVDLSGADLRECDLTGTRLVGANLSDAILQGANLTNAELLGANLTDADLSNANLEQAGLGRVEAVRALFFSSRCENATFSGSNLSDADFRAANLHEARLRDANLSGASFDAATISETDLTGVTATGASFRNADLRGSQLRGILDFKSADWIGVDIRDVDFTGAWLLRRHVQDENFIAEFRAQSRRHEILYWLWAVTSDCGRSLARWSVWTVLVAVIYAALYTQTGIQWGDAKTPLSPLYYSVVTFTTLGYGDVLPGSIGSQILAMSEVILGYFSLGGMMSILSDKMARRAG